MVRRSLRNNCEVSENQLAEIFAKSHCYRRRLHKIPCEIEADFNDRALTTISDSVHDPQPLMPSQLMLWYRLNGTSIAVLDREEDDDSNIFNTELLSRRQKNVCEKYFNVSKLGSGGNTSHLSTKE